MLLEKFLWAKGATRQLFSHSVPVQSDKPSAKSFPTLSWSGHSFLFDVLGDVLRNHLLGAPLSSTLSHFAPPSFPACLLDCLLFFPFQRGCQTLLQVITLHVNHLWNVRRGLQLARPNEMDPFQLFFFLFFVVNGYLEPEWLIPWSVHDAGRVTRFCLG